MAWGLDIRQLVIENRQNEVLLGIESLKITFRCCIGIVGGSGAGKSLFARALAGIMPFSTTMAGRADITRCDGGQEKTLKKDGIQLIPQSPGSALPRAITCKELLTRVHAWAGLTADDGSVEVALARVGLDGKQVGRLQVSQLSGGMAQRFSIAIAIANNSEFVIFDEPTVGLDAQSKRKALSLIESLLDDGRGVAIVSHDRACSYMFDRVVVVKDRSVSTTDGFP